MGERLGLKAAALAIALLGVMACDGREPVVPPVTDPGVEEIVAIDLDVGLPRDGAERAEKLADFGTVAVGTRTSLSARLVNRGDHDVLVTGSAVEAPFETDLPEAGHALSPGGEAMLVLGFAPGARGVADGILRLTVRSGDRAEEIRVRLAGRGERPALDCAPEKIEFGFVSVGSSKGLPFRCENPESIPFPVEARVSSSDLDGIVAVEWTTPSPDGGAVTVPADGLIEGRVILHPREASVIEGEIEFVSSGGSPIATLAVRGTGVEPQVDPRCEFDVVPRSLDFGVVEPGRTRKLRFGIRNVGSATGPDCTVESLRLSADSDPAFSLEREGGFVVPPGVVVEVPVTLAPTTAGATFAGRVLFVVPDGEEPLQEVELRGDVRMPCIDFFPAATSSFSCDIRFLMGVSFRSVCSSVEVDRIDILPGPHAHAFSVFSKPPLPHTLAGNEVANFGLGFDPASAEAQEVSAALGVWTGPDLYVLPLAGRAIGGREDFIVTSPPFQDRLPLTTTPLDGNGDGVVDERDLELFVSTEEIPTFDETFGALWSYDAEANAVVLRFAALPEPGTEVRIRYTAPCSE